MGEHTNIEWADSTLNLQMGCDGCELWTGAVRMCYAGVLTERYAGTNKGFPESFDQPKLYLERLDKALRWKDLTGTERPDKPWLNGLPRMIFLNDMGDTFTESLPIDWLAPLLPRMAESPHVWLLLTKRSMRLRTFSEMHPLPPNVWPGVSVTSARTHRRCEVLLEVEGGGPKWVSAEPLLVPVKFVDFSKATMAGDPSEYWHNYLCDGVGGGIDWIIAGGESGPGSRPCLLNWIRDIREQCQLTKTAFFLKQLGSNVSESFGHIGIEHVSLKSSKGGDWNEWPEDLRVREVPSCQ